MAHEGQRPRLTLRDRPQPRLTRSGWLAVTRALALASNRTANVTGAGITIDGGLILTW
jgi:hypothetical protein